MEFLNNKKYKLFGLVLFVILAYFISSKTEKVKNNEFSQNSEETEATIIDYQIKGAGAGLDHIITFEYQIDNKFYQKTVNTSIWFTNCYESRECIGKIFILYYKSDNPNDVRIDFNRPIRNFPKIKKIDS